MSKNHLIWEIPTRNQQMIRKHDSDDETKDIHLNASQKAINNKGRTISSMTIFPWFRQEIMKNNLWEDLRGKCIVLHFLIPQQARIILIMEKMRNSESILTVKVLKIMKV